MILSIYDVKIKMDFSVIIPTFNRFGFLQNAIDSVLTQKTKYSFELIIVDDHSTDKEYKEFINNRKFKIYVNSCKGVGSARNLGASYASGEYLIFCDDDDLLCQNFIEITGDILSQHKANWLVYNSIITTDNLESKYKKFSKAPDNYWYFLQKLKSFTIDYGKDIFAYYINTQALFTKLLSYQFFLNSGQVVKKCCFQEIKGFDNKFSKVRGEDFHFTARLVNQYPYGIISHFCGTKIRRHQDNFSGNVLLNDMGDLIVLFALLNDKNFDKTRQEILYKINQAWAKCLYQLFNNNKLYFREMLNLFTIYCCKEEIVINVFVRIKYAVKYIICYFVKDTKYQDTKYQNKIILQTYLKELTIFIKE